MAKVICSNCGKFFQKKPSQIKKAKRVFCSRICKSQHQTKEVKLVCPHCNKEFFRPPSVIKARKNKILFCSRKCQKKSHIISKICPQCGRVFRGRKSKIKRKKFCSRRCMGEARKRNKNKVWRGGRTKHTRGAILIYKPEHPLAWNTGYVSEHRLNLEKKLKRYLKPEEVVHHINGKKDDNRIENLMLCKNQKEHLKIHRADKSKL